MHEEHTIGKIQKSNYFERQRGPSSTAKRHPGVSIFSDTQVQNLGE